VLPQWRLRKLTVTADKPHTFLALGAGEDPCWSALHVFAQVKTTELFKKLDEQLCKKREYYVVMQDVRPTIAVLGILRVFLDGLDQPQHGYKLIKATGYSAAKTYNVLARLHTAGWLDRFDDPDASPKSGGPPRITYRLRADAVPKARRLIAETQKEFAPTPARRRLAGGTAHALGWAR
jgi:hypothetical protein